MYLNCHSAFSLRYGALSVAELLDEAEDKGVSSLALTDINNTSACMDFVRESRARGIRPVVGIEFRNEDRHVYSGLARSADGFRELNSHLSRHVQEGRVFPDRAPEMEGVSIVYPWDGPIQRPEDLHEDEYVGIHIRELPQLYSSPFRHRQDQLVIRHPVTFRNKAGYNLHRLLRAIDKNKLLSKQTVSERAEESDFMLQVGELMEHFKDQPRIITNTLRLLDSCTFEPDLKGIKNKEHFTNSRYDDRLLLEKLAYDGLRHRYGPNDGIARDRVDRELDIIDRLGFSSYFLVTWDFVRYGQSRGFFHVGRGSGANSIVAYCMGITDVDPIDLDLYFERFLNPYRSSPPDFDIDFSWKDRDDVIDYIFKRYGTAHTALLATYNTFQGRAVIRELGKVFGLPKAEIDQLVAMRRSPQVPDKIARLIYRYGQLMQGLPNHLGIHPGGIVISEAPLHSYTATQIPPKGFPITQFDMFVAEDIGLYKYDVLSQRGLGHIRDSADEVRRNQGRVVDVHQVANFKVDPAIRDLLRAGRTVGCFYVESPAMRQLLRKLKCETYLGLVAASSIIRPGVARSGMMKEFIQRHNNPDSFSYLHPKMESLLAETYGVMVYQEDVIKVAHHFAGLDLAESDVLRRAMSGKYRGKQHFEEIQARFFENCRERGYPDGIAKEVWRQIESFSGYSFSKAHSASFAVESYQSLFFKAHYPIEFMVGVINNFGGFYRTEIYVHEARMWGAVVHGICVNRSNYLTKAEGNDVWLGFVHLQHFEKQFAVRLLEERHQHGVFRDLEDVVRRTSPGLEQLILLIRVGALRFTGLSKKSLLWEAHLRCGKGPPKIQKTVLFEGSGGDFSLPDLPDDLVEDAYDQLELLGFPLCSPFELTAEQPDDAETLSADFSSFLGKRVSLRGYLVCTKTVKTVKGEYMQFGCFLDAAGDFFDTVHFPPSLARYPLTGISVYRLVGKVVEEFGFFSMEVDRLERMPYLPDPRGETYNRWADDSNRSRNQANPTSKSDVH